MKDLISLGEAASVLGVSKETLRNWDRSGKLKPTRNPMNNYRMYRLEDVNLLVESSVIREQESVYDTSGRKTSSSQDEPSNDKDIKRILSKIHRILRDTDGSSIVERFDETTETSVLSEAALRTVLQFLRHVRPPRSYHQRPTQNNSVIDSCRQLLKPPAVSEKFSNLGLSDDAFLNEIGQLLSTVLLRASSQDIKDTRMKK